MAVARLVFVVLSALWLLFAAAYLYVLLDERDGIMWGYGLAVGRDFNVFWSAAHAAADGRLLEIFNRIEFWHLRQEYLGHEFPFMGAWLYPPHYLLMLSPLATMPYLVGYAVFTGGTLLVYLAIAVRLQLKRWAMPALAVSPATFFAIEYGQNGFLTASLLIPGVVLLDRRPVLAGVLFGILTFKPTVGILVVVGLVAARAWKTAAIASAVGLGLMAVATSIYGVEAWTLLITEPMSDQIAIMTAEDPLNVSIMMSLLPRLSYYLDGSPFAYVGQGVATVLAIGMTYRVFRVTRDVSTRALTVAAGTCLATPYLFIYDLPMLALALAFYVQSHALRAREAAALIALWFLPQLPLLLPTAAAAGALVQLWWRAERTARLMTRGDRLTDRQVDPEWTATRISA